MKLFGVFPDTKLNHETTLVQEKRALRMLIIDDVFLDPAPFIMMVWLLILLITYLIFYFDTAEITCNDTGASKNKIKK